MKNTMYLMLLFLSFGIQAQQKEQYTHKFTYDYTYQIDSTNSNSKRTAQMALLVNNEKSYFCSNNLIISDSLGGNKTIGELGGAAAASAFLKQAKLPRIRIHTQILKNRKTLDLTYYEKIYYLVYTYDETYNMKWKLASETKEIAGYSCQKATMKYAGRNYTAWYTTAIPMSDGPFKFRGLPGLILEIYDAKNQHHFTITKIANQTGNFLPILKRNLVKTSPKKLLTERKKTRAEMVKAAIMMNPDKSPEQIKMLKEKYKRKNNPIELQFDYYKAPTKKK